MLLTTNAPAKARPGPAPQPPDSDEHLEHADQLLTLMASIRRRGGSLAKRPVELSSLTSSEIDLVRVVLRRPGISVNQAADELRLAPNTVSTLVRQLTDQNLVIRSVDPLDRRVAKLALTPSMQRKVGEFRDRRVAMLGAAMDQLSAADQRRLGGFLGTLERISELLQEVGPPDE